MLKKIVSLSLILMMILSMCACNNSNAVKYDEYKKIADNLYEVTVDGYDYDYLFEGEYGNIDFVYSGCSGIKEGAYLGRNFDFVLEDASEIIVKTPAKKDRYASVGMVGGLLWLSADFIESGLDEDAKNLIPLMLLDGINEKGLAVEINCVNSADVGGLTMHTDPGKKEVPQLCMVRYLLDNAASADEAVEIMKNVDIVNTRDVMGLIANAFEIHFLIADKDKSYVVEFDNTKPDGEKLIIMEDESIMTNFYLHIADPENDIYSENSMGIERYRKLKDNRSSVSSVETMKDLMESIRFSNSNRLDGEYDPGENFDNPYTCFSDHPVSGENGFNYKTHREHIPEIMEIMRNDGAKITKVLQDPKLNNPDLLWGTSHTAVYDLENRSMSVAVFERYDNYYKYIAG